MSVFTNRMADAKRDANAYSNAVVGLLGDRDPLSVLSKTEAALRKAVKGLSPRQLGRREAPGKWAIRHVVQHLVDSETVWAWRLRLVLAQDRPTITGYDQDAWADRLGYDKTNVEQALDEFSVLRRANLRLLKRASAADLDRVGVHSERGEESVRHWLKMYAGHDTLHLNQIKRIRESLRA
jgi:hypothetical protein